jgi:hypothetical protein
MFSIANVAIQDAYELVKASFKALDIFLHKEECVDPNVDCDHLQKSAN